jgi:hypothetical protein
MRLEAAVAYEDKGEQGHDPMMAQCQHDWVNTKRWWTDDVMTPVSGNIQRIVEMYRVKSLTNRRDHNAMQSSCRATHEVRQAFMRSVCRRLTRGKGTCVNSGNSRAGLLCRCRTLGVSVVMARR